MVNNSYLSVPKSVVAGAFLALLAVLFSFGLGGVFGAAEDSVKGYLSNSGKAALESVYQGDVQKMTGVVNKSWEYLKRAHLHSGVIGGIALASISVLILMTNLGFIARASSLALGLGSFAYSFVWFIAGLKAPAIGSTGAAKHSVELLAIFGAGLAILGVIGAIVAILGRLFSNKS